MRLTAAAFEKSDGSIVTEADGKAEEFMRSVFEKETPEANIWSEEYGRDDNHMNNDFPLPRRQSLSKPRGSF